MDIAIIESDTYLRECLHMAFTQKKWTTHSFSKGSLFLKHVEIKGYPSLIIQESMLPDMMGLELIKQVRAFRKTIPIVVLTWCRDTLIKQNFIDAGVHAYVTKPFHIYDFLHFMHNLTLEQNLA